MSDYDSLDKMDDRAHADAWSAFTKHTPLDRSTAVEAARVLRFAGDIDDAASLSQWVTERHSHPAFKTEYKVEAMQTLHVWAAQLGVR